MNTVAPLALSSRSEMLTAQATAKTPKMSPDGKLPEFFIYLISPRSSKTVLTKTWTHVEVSSQQTCG